MTALSGLLAGGILALAAALPARGAEPLQECLELRAPAAGAIARKARPVARIDRELFARAGAGDPDAAFLVAVRYFDGDCVRRSYAEALRWFDTAAAAGHWCAAAAASWLRAEGLGAERDPAVARAGFRGAQAAGCARAFYLQALVEDRTLRPERHKLARELLERGAALGDGHALNALGAERERDDDRPAAEALYRRAAQVGNRAAPVNLGRLERWFSRRERRESLESLRHRAALREAAAAFALAQRYHRGDGVTADYTAAIRLYRLAAELRHPPAAEMLALVLSRTDPRTGGVDVAWMRVLAYAALASDESGKSRGVSQPVIDDDPFYDMVARGDAPANR